jgi:hypothetical protein
LLMWFFYALSCLRILVCLFISPMLSTLFCLVPCVFDETRRASRVLPRRLFLLSFNFSCVILDI